MKPIVLAAGAAVAALAWGSLAQAAVFNGTAYYTYFSDQQVASVAYSYDDSTHSFTLQTPQQIATLPGADGLLFAPGGQNILVGGQGTGNVYSVNLATHAVTTDPIGSSSYHLALNGNTLYTSGPYFTSNAPLVSATVNPDGTLSNVQSQSLTGNDTQVTQLAFANGQAFYTDSQPNCCGNIGAINLATGQTTQLYSGVTSAHGIVVDPFTGLLDLFGGGWVGTLDPTNPAGPSSLKQFDVPGIGDFDQGSPDGFGHALIAGGSSITFIDYSVSHDITNPDYYVTIGGFTDIDDIAPLAGAGSISGGVPEPSAWGLMILGFGLAGAAFRRRRTAAFA